MKTKLLSPQFLYAEIFSIYEVSKSIMRCSLNYQGIARQTLSDPKHSLFGQKNDRVTPSSIYALAHPLLSFSVMKKKVTKKTYPERAQDVPVTQKMLYLVRDELKADIKSLEHKINARFEGQNSKFKSIDSRFESIDARFESIDARFESIDSKLEKLTAEFHSMKLLIEEQNAKNNIVLDGLTSLFHRQDRVEKLVSGN